MPANYLTAWSGERSDEAVRRWKAGESYSEIAAAMGNGLTRSAIAGRLARLKIPKRIQPKQSMKNAPSRVTREKIVKAALAKGERASGFLPPKPVPSAPDSEPVSLLELKAHQCKFALATPPEVEVTLFCGARRAFSSPYCGVHAAITKAEYQITMKQTMRAARLSA